MSLSISDHPQSISLFNPPYFLGASLGVSDESRDFSDLLAEFVWVGRSL